MNRKNLVSLTVFWILVLVIVGAEVILLRFATMNPGWVSGCGDAPHYDFLHPFGYTKPISGFIAPCNLMMQITPSPLVYQMADALILTVAIALSFLLYFVLRRKK